MAINEYDLFESSDALSEVTTTDYTEKEETASSNKASGVSSDAEKKSSLDKSELKEQSADAANGVEGLPAEDNYTSSSIPKSVKSDEATAKLNRDLDARRIDASGDVETDNKSFLSKVTENLGLDKISVDAEFKLDAIIGTEIGCISQYIGIASKLPIANKIKHEVDKAVSKYGAAMGEVKKIIDVLTACDDKTMANYACGTMANIRFSILGILFDTSSCRGIGAVLSIVGALTGNDSLSRAAVTRGLMISMNKDDDPYTLDKLSVLSAVYSDPNVTESDKIKLRSTTAGANHRVFKNTRESEGKSTSNSITVITNDLDTVDPNWNKDSQGQENYHRTRGNKTFYNKSNKESLSTSKKPTTIDGTNNTALKRSEKILMIGKNVM